MEDERVSPDSKDSDHLKKKMPLITTYVSDDDDYDDDLDNAPLSEVRASVAPFPFCDVEVIDLVSEPTPPPSPPSDVETDAREVEKLNEALAKASRLSLYKWLNSDAFQLLRADQPSGFTEKERIPRSFVIFFHEKLNAVGVSENSLSSNKRLFSTMLEEALAQWKALTPEERKAYRKRAMHTKASYTQHLLDCRSKFNAVASSTVPRCANPSCNQPVVFDRRWNLDYCSADCVVAHTKEAFNTWIRAGEPSSASTVKQTSVVVVKPPGKNGKSDEPQQPVNINQANKTAPMKLGQPEKHLKEGTLLEDNIFERLQNPSKMSTG